MKKPILFVVFLLILSHSLTAQLDSIHWCPPMHARVEWGPQFLVLSTPETTPFPVSIKDGSGTVIQTVSISNTTPFTYNIGSSNNTFTLVPANDLHKALKNRGLVIEAEKKFYAYFRAHASSQNQAADLTLKGLSALGKTFRIGHLLQNSASSASRSNFVGVLATEDSTVVDFSGFDPATNFYKNNANTPSTGRETVTLQKGESLVFSMYLATSNTAQPPNGFMGGLLETSKPVAVNVGSWTGSPASSPDQDVGIDQIVPFENVGTEYIINRANGSAVLERPMVVAHVNGTRVFLNDSTTPVATLNAGQTYIVATNSFTAQNNLYIKTSEPVYLYQMIGGAPAGTAHELRTEGLIFVPPISCSIPNTIDNIADVNVVGSMSFDGGVMITAMRDSQVVVRVNGATVNLGAANPVMGNPDFVTYRNLTAFSASTRVTSLSVVAQGSVQVAVYGQNQAASYAAFYSGFSKTKKPKVKLVNIGDGVCPDTLIATGFFDGVQWIYEDSVLKFGKDTMLIVSAPGRYIAEGYLGVCRRSETARDTLDISFRSPEFPYTTKEPTCFGLSNGSISIGRPAGGFPPYQYSIDNGQTFTRTPNFPNIKSDFYKLVVKDSLGCYNKPLQIKMGQPAQFTVRILPDSMPEPVSEGQLVRLTAQPNRRAVTAVWQPQDTTGCKNCLEYVIKAKEKVQILLTVTDSLGCTAFDTIVIYVQPSIFAPNVINPNSTFGNNAFTVFSKENLPIRRLQVYDRWGNCVFKTENTETNVLEKGWDGTYNGQPVNPDVFVYWAEIEVLPNRIVRISGDVTVLR
jgi:gliding motility-associated-like protein